MSRSPKFTLLILTKKHWRQHCKIVPQDLNKDVSSKHSLWRRGTQKVRLHAFSKHKQKRIFSRIQLFHAYTHLKTSYWRISINSLASKKNTTWIGKVSNKWYCIKIQGEQKQKNWPTCFKNKLPFFRFFAYFPTMRVARGRQKRYISFKNQKLTKMGLLELVAI